MAERNGIRCAHMFRVVHCGIGVTTSVPVRDVFRPADRLLFRAKGDDQFIFGSIVRASRKRRCTQRAGKGKPLFQNYGRDCAQQHKFVAANRARGKLPARRLVPGDA